VTGRDGGEGETGGGERKRTGDSQRILDNARESPRLFREADARRSAHRSRILIANCIARNRDCQSGNDGLKKSPKQRVHFLGSFFHYVTRDFTSRRQ